MVCSYSVRSATDVHSKIYVHFRTLMQPITLSANLAMLKELGSAYSTKSMSGWKGSARKLC